MYTIQYRYVEVRSPTVKDKQPLCLVDHAPQYGGHRDALIQQCGEAASVFDGREVWLVNHWPSLSRY